MKYLSILVLLLFVGLGYSSQDQQHTAQEILDRMISAYTSCNTYMDEGEVRTIFIEQKGRRTLIRPFSTAFVRPSEFRFEYKARRGEDEWDSYIIWKDAQSIKTWWSIKPEVESPTNLSSALAAAAGVSGGASHTIPSLLLPETMSRGHFKYLSELKIAGEEEVNGKSAYKIEGTDSRKNIITLWVDKLSLLIVKMFEKRKFETFETETTTTYKPQINAEVMREKLAFNPPQKEN